MVRGRKGRRKARDVRQRQQSTSRGPILPDIVSGTTPPASPSVPAGKPLSGQRRKQKSKLRKTQKRSRSKIARGLNRTERKKLGILRRKNSSSLTAKERAQLQNLRRRNHDHNKSVKASRKKRKDEGNRRRQKDRTRKIKREKERKKTAHAARTKAVMGRLPPSGRVYKPVVSRKPLAESDKWLKVTEPNTGRQYWHNPRTGKSSWTKPVTSTTPKSVGTTIATTGADKSKKLSAKKKISENTRSRRAG